MPDDKTLDAETAARMGYGRVLRAAGFDHRGVPVEIALFEPHDHWTEYGVPIHWDCDPEEPTRGSSEMNNYGTLEEAVEAYEREFARIADEVRPVAAPRG